MKKNYLENEIDISPIVNFLIEKKLRIFLIMVISITTTFLFYIYTIDVNKTEVKDYKVKIPINFIKPDEDLLYENYNAFIRYLNNDKVLSSIDQFLQDKKNNPYIFNQYYIDLKSRVIDKKSLYKYFISFLLEGQTVIDFINKNYSKKNVVLDESKLKSTEYLVKNSLTLETNIIDYPGENLLNLTFNIKDNLNLEKLVTEIEKSTNLKVREYLISSFNYEISAIKQLQNYIVDDLKKEYKELDDKTSYYFKRRIEYIESDRSLERLNTLFNSTPILNKDNFKAARLNLNKSQIRMTNTKGKNNLFRILVIGTILGLFLIILYSKIEYALKSKK